MSMMLINYNVIPASLVNIFISINTNKNNIID